VNENENEKEFKNENGIRTISLISELNKNENIKDFENENINESKSNQTARVAFGNSTIREPVRLKVTYRPSYYIAYI
jgi:hypothetical protein